MTGHLPSETAAFVVSEDLKEKAVYPGYPVALRFHVMSLRLCRRMGLPSFVTQLVRTIECPLSERCQSFMSASL
jgi:hypothetical protein